ncbi:Predicted ATPase [Nakamurella panacisegetis]|uniref:Predicted ATPase n=1 Tax=Nakamurella panacisegetis TaxID=1090615 RepID=A0A1H0L878_9ACTN|nr:Predicted ATPase [Nakamurella panacisegetis]
MTNGDLKLSGLELGGRRARVALVALALADGPLPAERLADIIWAGAPPPTWQPALRGVIRALRTTLSPIGLGHQQLITTEPAGYALHPTAQTDLRIARRDLENHTELDTLTKLNPDDLLPQEDAAWLRAHREAIDHIRSRAAEIVITDAITRGDHTTATRTARDLLEHRPLDEPAHRLLITALGAAGDRTGAVRAYEHCRTLLAEQLGIDPSTETVAVYLHALRSEAPSTSPRVPLQPGAFVGRQREQRELETALHDPGLVTLTGRGGIGKSRLAAKASTGRQAAWITVTAQDDELAASQVALDLRLTLGDADPATAIADHFAPLGRTLLVLDACENAGDGVASLVSQLLQSCPNLTILATSRSALGVDGERVLRLNPLHPIHPGTDLLTNPQVQLLLHRVAEGGGRITFDDGMSSLISALCQRCAGLPLALELIAAQLTVMSPADLLEELADAPSDRLTAVLEHSYAPLRDDEAAVFRRLSVLRGPVGLPLIRSVVSDADVQPVRVIRILRELTDRALLTVDREGPRWRYQLDDDIQTFATTKLTPGEQQAAFGRLADTIRSLLPDNATATPTGFADAIAELGGSVRSLLAAAVDGCVNRERGLEIAFRLHRYWAATNVSEGIFWLSRLLEHAPETPWTGLANFAHGFLSYWTGDAESALRILDTAVRQLRGIHDDFAARALIYLGGIADDLDRGAEAVTYVKESVAVADRLGEHNLYVGAAMGVGSVLAERGDPAAADFALAALGACRRRASSEQLASALPTAVMISWQVGALPQARELLAEGLTLHPDGRRIARVVLLTAGCGISLADRDVAQAISLGRTADEIATTLGVERELPLVRALLARALHAGGHRRDATDRAIAAIRAARALTYDHPLALCLETTTLLYPGSPGRDRLLATAAELRARGDRPAPATLPAPTGSPDAEPMSAEEAAALAISTLLGGQIGTDQHTNGILIAPDR